jgi:hypothetical protein
MGVWFVTSAHQLAFAGQAQRGMLNVIHIFYKKKNGIHTFFGCGLIVKQ